MKKKVLIIIAIIAVLGIGLFVLTGCGDNETESQIESNISSNKSITNEFSIGDKTFKFDKETTFKNFTYKNAEELEPDESKHAVYLEYENKEIYDGRFVFRISLAYTDENTLNEFLEGRTTTDKKINGTTWKTLSIDNTSNNKEITSINYVTEKDGTLYVVSILVFKEANVDITKLADVFMNGVTLK